MPIYTSPDTIRALGGTGLKHCDSRSLWKDKFLFFDSAFDEDKRVALDLYLPRGRADIATLRSQWTADKSKQERNRSEGKRVNENDLRKATAALPATAAFTDSAPKPITRSRHWLTALPADRACTFQLKTTSRLIVGLVNGALENAGCTLHPLFGFPVIPGSALKGIARDAAAVLGKSDAVIQRVFGGAPENEAHARQGDVSFVDAHAILRAGENDIELDIVTPHFQQYYGGTGNPNALDEESPVPSVFPAVCAGVTFEFALIALTTRLNDDAARQALDLAKECLVHGLTHLGIGAKTAAGYGRFGDLAATPSDLRQDLFPPPPKPVLTPEEEIRANWLGQPVNGFNVARLIKALLLIEERDNLAAAFDAVFPADQLANFRTANPFWTTFLQRGGKAILDRINRQLPRQ